MARVWLHGSPICETRLASGRLVRLMSDRAVLVSKRRDGSRGDWWRLVGLERVHRETPAAFRAWAASGPRLQYDGSSLRVAPSGAPAAPAPPRAVPIARLPEPADVSPAAFDARAAISAAMRAQAAAGVSAPQGELFEGGAA